jgi:glycolate oxidase iron-sulfur subunit
MADLCCGSAGVYNILQSSMADSILKRKMETIQTTRAEVIVTANPGCMLQLAAGAKLYGSGQRVAHVVEVLDEAYRNFAGRALVKTSRAKGNSPFLNPGQS